jgi:lipopolysaccharide transport system ATP-binding protein
MAAINLENVGVDLPVFNASSRSLKQRVLGAATGGRLAADAAGHVSVRALDGVSLRFADGDRVGLIGHNGAGKSSLLRVLGGAYAPTQGRVVIEGDVCSLIDVSLGIDPEATGRENIVIRGALLGMKRSEINQHTHEIIEFADLGDFIDMPLRTYSAGMNLRLAFAISTIVQPQILLMDEWLAVGDENFKVKMEERLDQMVRSSSILVIATHSKDLVAQLCNRVVWLKHGRVEADGSLDILPRYFSSQDAA